MLFKRVLWLLGLVVAFFLGALGAELLGRQLNWPALAAIGLVQVSILTVGLLFAWADGAGVRSLGLIQAWKGIDPALIAGIIGLHWTGSIITGIFLQSAGQMDLEGKAVTSLFRTFTEYDPASFFLIALGLALVTGLAEEVLFRGYLITRLERLGLGAWSCILLSALIFGLIHWPGYGLWPSLSKALWFGVPTGAYFWYRRNLGPLVVAHALVDFFGFSLAYLIFKYFPDLGGL